MASHRRLGWLCALAVVVHVSEGVAGDDPSDATLTLAGAAMAVPTYFIGVAVHEGSHALAAKLTGAEVVEARLLPHVHRGNFYFGRVQVRGLRSEAQRNFFLMAPKISDLVLVTGYAVALESGALPDNRYGLMAFTVLATGFWVDFTRDLFAFWDHNDTVKVYNSWGMRTEVDRLPMRLVHASLSAAMAVLIVRGYDRVYGADAPPSDSRAILPVWATTF